MQPTILLVKTWGALFILFSAHCTLAVNWPEGGTLCLGDAETQAVKPLKGETIQVVLLSF